MLIDFCFCTFSLELPVYRKSTCVIKMKYRVMCSLLNFQLESVVGMRNKWSTILRSLLPELPKIDNLPRKPAVEWLPLGFRSLQNLRPYK